MICFFTKARIHEILISHLIFNILSSKKIRFAHPNSEAATYFLSKITDDWLTQVHSFTCWAYYLYSKLRSEAKIRKKVQFICKGRWNQCFFWNFYFKMELAALEVKKRKILVDYFSLFVLSIVCSCCGHSLKIVKLPDVFAVRPPSLNQSRHKQSSFYT